MVFGEHDLIKIDAGHRTPQQTHKAAVLVLQFSSKVCAVQAASRSQGGVQSERRAIRRGFVTKFSQGLAQQPFEFQQLVGLEALSPSPHGIEIPLCTFLLE